MLSKPFNLMFMNIGSPGRVYFLRKQTIMNKGGVNTRKVKQSKIVTLKNVVDRQSCKNSWGSTTIL